MGLSIGRQPSEPRISVDPDFGEVFFKGFASSTSLPLGLSHRPSRVRGSSIFSETAESFSSLEIFLVRPWSNPARHWAMGTSRPWQPARASASSAAGTERSVFAPPAIQLPAHGSAHGVERSWDLSCTIRLSRFVTDVPGTQVHRITLPGKARSWDDAPEHD